MIKFFRKIRQKLLTENKLSKYLLYAFGEIILVVIGILIALQINNLNEQNKIDQKQRNYLTLIKNEMSNNLDALETEDQKLNGLLEGLKEFLILKDKSPSEISEKVLSDVLMQVLKHIIAFKYENGALTELISSGILKDIPNENIRNTLASWESKIAKVVIQENTVNKYLSKGNNFIEKYGNFRLMINDAFGNNFRGVKESLNKESNKHLLEIPEFENICVFVMLTAGSLQEG